MRGLSGPPSGSRSSPSRGAQCGHSLGSGRGEDGGTAEGATRGGLPWPPLALLMEEKPRSGDREAPRVRPPRAMAQVFSWNHCQRLGSCGGGGRRAPDKGAWGEAGGPAVAWGPWKQNSELREAGPKRRLA